MSFIVGDLKLTCRGIVFQEKRHCRAGAGDEENQGKGDTPGFQRRAKPALVRDHRNYHCLELVCNSTRMVQSSMHLLKIWRGNCDVKVLVYNSDPDFPDATDIAMVTDYIVAYACKGNATLKEEKDHVKSVILRYVLLIIVYTSFNIFAIIPTVVLVPSCSAREETGLQCDVMKLTRQFLNKAVAERAIPKPECMVELANLDLVLCSDIIQNVSISGHYKVMNRASTTFVTKYQKRPDTFKHLSLKKYFHHIKSKKTRGKTIIPHFVGGQGQPVYPVTEAYARATLIIHKPWTDEKPLKYQGTEWIEAFLKFIRTPECPLSVKISFERVKARFTGQLSKHVPLAQHYETIEEEEEIPDEETKLLLDVVNSLSHDLQSNDQCYFHRGYDYDWSHRQHPVRP